MFGMFNAPQQIECPEARHMVQNHGAQLVDVRSPEEHAQGTLPGSVNVPLQILQQAHQQLDKSKPVIVYCVSGARSAQAVSFLQSMGFDNVHNLGSIRKYLTC
jgi:phage shock protein E